MHTRSENCHRLDISIWCAHTNSCLRNHCIHVSADYYKELRAQINTDPLQQMSDADKEKLLGTVLDTLDDDLFSSNVADDDFAFVIRGIMNDHSKRIMQIELLIYDWSQK